MSENIAYFKCITNKYSNLIKGKIYKAIARDIYVKTKEPCDYYIYDEDGDIYPSIERNTKLFKRI